MKRKEGTQTILTPTRNLTQINTIPSEAFVKSELSMWRMWWWWWGEHTLLKRIRSGCRFHQPATSLPTDLASAFDLLEFKKFCPFHLGKDYGSIWGMSKSSHGHLDVCERTGHGNTGPRGPFTSGTFYLVIQRTQHHREKQKHIHLRSLYELTKMSSCVEVTPWVQCSCYKQCFQSTQNSTSDWEENYSQLGNEGSSVFCS